MSRRAPRIRQVVESRRSTDIDRRTTGYESPARPEAQDALPAERGPPSILIWGTPMRIDPTWEEIFAKRERDVGRPGVGPDSGRSR